METNRRSAIMLTGSALITALAGCGPANAPTQPVRVVQANAKPTTSKAPRPIGDGSTAHTGPQPHQPTLPDLAAGSAPPQFVVFSWDGGGETDAHLLTRFRTVAKEIGASMTIFLSGIYLLREADAKRYHAPRHDPGDTDIPFLSDGSVKRTIEGVGAAWLEGHEIGTHFNGHFCGPGGVGDWTSKEWRDEIDQAVWMVKHWRTTTGWTSIPSLPFDYDKELIGSRTPCLLGSDALLPTAQKLGWRYDSSTSTRQVWPTRFEGTTMWNLGLSQIPFPGHKFEVLAMDYNYMANQSGPQPGKDASKYPGWKTEALGALLAGHERAPTGTRAPRVSGNHCDPWTGGISLDAIAEARRTLAKAPDTYLVSFRQLVDWLDRQDPILLGQLTHLDVGQVPEGGWAGFGAE